MLVLIATVATFLGIGGAYFYSKRKPKPSFTVCGVDVFLVKRDSVPDYEEMHRTATVLDLLQSKNLVPIKDERSLWTNFNAAPVDSSALRLAVQKGIEAFQFRARIASLPYSINGIKIKITNYPATRWVGARHHTASHGMMLISDKTVSTCTMPEERGGMKSLSSAICHELGHYAIALKNNGDPDFKHIKHEALWSVFDSAID